MIALLPLLRRWWPALAAVAFGIAVTIAIGRIEHNAYKRGEAAERAKWEAQAAKDAERIRQAYDAAAKLAAEARAQRTETFRPIEQEAQAYARKPEAAARCVDDDGARVMQRAIDAANNASAPTG